MRRMKVLGMKNQQKNFYFKTKVKESYSPNFNGPVNTNITGKWLLLFQLYEIVFSLPKLVVSFDFIKNTALNV